MCIYNWCVCSLFVENKFIHKVVVLPITFNYAIAVD